MWMQSVPSQQLVGMGRGTQVIPHLLRRSEIPGIIKYFLDHHGRPGRRCRRIRLDQAGEHRSQDVEDMARGRGIALELTGTDQHQQNGDAEATNKLIMERTMATLHTAGLDKKYWPYVAKAMGYLRLFSPHLRFPCTPYEAWYGEKPDLSHLRILGLPALAYSTNRTHKWAERGVKCRLLDLTM